ncbi:MAG: aminotransferase class V-fold PLP-dependent enzyme [Candidatus Lernaella stagnicola]|nr:aminotransferase class V-fold PLP-dependent enzyme [Candidatus Lernaella stagnicola]
MNDAARLYFDNAATSYPKPESVYEAMDRYARQSGGSAGRSAHRHALDGSRLLFHLRTELAELLGGDEDRVVLTMHATEAINLALFSLLEPGATCLHGALEHNAVMRPLAHLAATRKAHLVEVPGDDQGRMTPAALDRALHETGAKLVVTLHASNVNGAAQDVAALSEVAARHDARFVVDAAQSAGVLDLDQKAMGIDALCVTGHKALFGPTGTGALLLSETVSDRIQARMHGGTGSQSESEHTPDFLPDRLEAGTPNTFGAAGLLAGIRFVRERGVADIARHERELRSRMIDRLRAIDDLTVYGDMSGPATSVVSFTCSLAPSDVAFLLAERYGIAVRPGLHCAPRAHRTLGTMPAGTLRLAPSVLTPVDAVDEVAAAIAEIVKLAS